MMGTLLRVDFAAGSVVPLVLLDPGEDAAAALELLGEGDDLRWRHCFGQARVHPKLRLVIGAARRWRPEPRTAAPAAGEGSAPVAPEALGPDLASAWALDEGLAALRSLAPPPVRIGVIDEGFDPALRPLLGPTTLVHLDAQARLQPSSWEPGPDAPTRHGTMMASVIGARALQGVELGVAPGAPLTLVQMWGDVVTCPIEGASLSLAESIRGWRELLGLLAAMEHLCEQSCRVVAVSRAWPDWGPAGRLIMAHVSEALLTQGVVPVFAVGNTGALERSLIEGLEGPLIVGARDRQGVASQLNLPGFNTLAPGMGVLCMAPGGRLGQASGSSVAAAVMAGAVALLSGATPQATAREVVEALKDSSWGVGSGASRRVGPGLLRAPDAASLEVSV